MKSTFVRQCLGLAVGLSFFGGCARPSAQPTQPPTVTAPASAQFPAPSAPLPPSASPGPEAPDTAAGATNPPAIEQRIPPSQPANMSPGVDEIAKLAQSGVSEEVMMAYVEKYPGHFNASADQIVYLNDLGVSTAVVTAMLRHDGSNVSPEAPAPAPAPQNQPVSNVPVYQSAPPEGAAPPPPVATPAATPPPSTDVTYFYDSLSPYGSWMFVSGYGWCWQPTVAVGPGWQPYCDRGRWYWSDSGWYWHSEYTWGWAPFHYGRWYLHPRSGWLWTPGTVWGPAWVSWRYADSYCGWAPLPPEAYWAPGVGFTFHGRHVSVGFEFGLGYHHYSFVSVGNFCDPHPYRHVLPRTQIVNVYRNTTVVNNYVVNHNTVVNRGVGRETIARHSPTPIRQIRVEQTSLAGGTDRVGRLERRGNDVVAYRPQLPKNPPVAPAVIQRRMEANLRQSQVAQAENRVGGGVPATRITTPTPATRGGPEGAVPRTGTPSRTSPAIEPRHTTPAIGNQPRVTEPRPATPSHTAPARVERPATAPLKTPSAVPHPSSSVPRAVTPTAPASPTRPVYSEPRPAAPHTSAPSMPARTAAIQTPSMSPRYTEQHSVKAPSAAPSYPAPAPSYSRPDASVPRASVPESRGSSGAERATGGRAVGRAGVSGRDGK